MNRRAFIATLGAATVWPLIARTQQPERMRRVGVLMPSAENDPENLTRVTPMRQGLQQLGWTEGRNQESWWVCDPT
jgi:putative tryptophan/tyrosine transport system substrate-binding protein